jgi:hypothetical protein
VTEEPVSIDDDAREPGEIHGFLGGMVAIGGAVYLLVAYNDGDDAGVIVGAVFLIGGLLMRIDAAIRSTVRRTRP